MERKRAEHKERNVMTIEMFGFVAETHVHVGIGRMEGAVDLPVAREGVSGYPFAPGSGVKGALRDHAEMNSKNSKNWIDAVFGKEGDATNDSGNAGSVLVGDLRLLLLPVRSLDKPFRMVTCPYLIERFCRDQQRTYQKEMSSPVFCDLKEKDGLPCVMASSNHNDDGHDEKFFLEERLVRVVRSIPDEITNLLKPVVPEGSVRDKLADRLVIVSDDLFTWLAANALPVNARNDLRDKKDEDDESSNLPSKKSKNVWYEETLPPDTVMTLILADRAGAVNESDSGVKKIKDLLCDNKYIQIGGNETVGQGWFHVTAIERE
jgi:CRISPR-associated protein Cmr4